MSDLAVVFLLVRSYDHHSRSCVPAHGMLYLVASGSADSSPRTDKRWLDTHDRQILYRTAKVRRARRSVAAGVGAHLAALVRYMKEGWNKRRRLTTEVRCMRPAAGYMLVVGSGRMSLGGSQGRTAKAMATVLGGLVEASG